MNDTQRMIEQALSLRAPQKESMNILAEVLTKISLSKDMSTVEALRLIQEVRPSVKDFERIFPCICFAIATGVGKTRLMGAMIAYIHIEYGVKNFMVLAPNLTIYNKLKTDFTPNTPKYVFPGIPDFAITPPQIITGDDYNQVGGLFDNPMMIVFALIFSTSPRLILIKMREGCRVCAVWLNTWDSRILITYQA